MLPVYLAADLTDAQLIVLRLNEAGIETRLHNQHLQGALGELPMSTSPEVWVARDEDRDAARSLILEIEAVRQEAPRPDISCQKCGEDNPYNFEICWSCRASL